MPVIRTRSRRTLLLFALLANLPFAMPAAAADLPPGEMEKTVKNNPNKDVREYLAGYPNQKHFPEKSKNLEFYRNQRESRPQGGFIDEIHEQWWGEWDDILEPHHGYIQWLFPLREPGLNSKAQVLQVHEAEEMKKDDDIQEKIIKSYRMMLDFYGMKMKDLDSGKIERSSHWRERFANLQARPHNYLRITRILKFLGEVGLERLKLPLLEFFRREVFKTNQLEECEDSLVGYWAHTLKSESQRMEYLEALRLDIRAGEAKGRYKMRTRSSSLELPSEKAQFSGEYERAMDEMMFAYLTPAARTKEVKARAEAQKRKQVKEAKAAQKAKEKAEARAKAAAEWSGPDSSDDSADEGPPAKRQKTLDGAEEEEADL